MKNATVALRWSVLVSAVLCVAMAVGQDRPKNNDPAARERLRIVNERLAAIGPYEQRAEEHYFAGEYVQAEVECQRAIVMYEAIDISAAMSAKILLAEIDLEVGRIDEAIQILEGIRQPSDPHISVSPSFRVLSGLVLGYLRLGNASQAQGRLAELTALATEARACPEAWSELQALRQGNSSSWQALALCLRAQEVATKRRALRYLSRAAQQAPTNRGVCLLYGVALRFERRWPEAKTQLERAASGVGRCADAARAQLKAGALPPPRSGG